MLQKKNKGLSIKLKVALLNAGFMLIIVTIVIVFMLYTSKKIIKENIALQLEEIVEKNSEEINYIDGLFNLNKMTFYEKEIYLYVYSNEGLLIQSHQSDIPYIDSMLSDNKITSKMIDDELYYMYDKYIELGEGIWVRGIALYNDDIVVTETYYIACILLPLIVLISAIGCYNISKKAFNPIMNMISTADKIKKEKDFSIRNNLTKNKDEIYMLGSMFNEMLDHLEEAYSNEKQFSSDVSHELRTPTSVILAQTEYALDKNITQEEKDHSLEVIRRQASKMIRIINNLLEIARIDNKNYKLDYQEENLSTLIEVICEEQKLIREKKIELKYDIKKDIYLNCDSDLIIRAISNLISNAYKYGKENGVIEITLEENKDDIKFKIKDNGIGIKQENLNKIWQRFYQVEPSRNNEQNSMGLGLSMVKEIINLHESNIIVESKVNKGTTFIINFKKN
ncbi:MAG: HAMP domain-containing sensor histidine kinase [bacterium]